MSSRYYLSISLSAASSATIVTSLCNWRMEAGIVDYWKRIPKESFQNWYKSQSRYRTKEASSVACWVYVQICETENSGRNAARIARCRPIYHCYWIAGLKDWWRKNRCCDRMKKNDKLIKWYQKNLHLIRRRKIDGKCELWIFWFREWLFKKS